MTGTDNYTKVLVKEVERYFTSMTIVEWLLNRGITCVGTLHTERQGIPAEVKDKSTMYFYNDELKSVLMSYVVKKTKGWKNVLVISSMHDSVKITKDERKKPSVIIL